MTVDPSLPGALRLRIPVREPAAGTLLLASPLLTEPPFDGTVIALLEHDDTGSLGVVLNRPTQVPVDTVLPDWHPVVEPPATLFQGGPVGLDSALALALLAPGTAEVSCVRPVGPRWGVVDLDADPTDVRAHVASVRMYAGYAGWSPGQLADEVLDGAWYVVDCAEPREDLMAADAGGLWSRIARRQRSDVRLLTHRVDDPEEN